MKVLKKHEWNTGRKYGHDGQPMVAWIVDLGYDGTWCVFQDTGRMLDEAFQWHKPSHIGVLNSEIEDVVMFLYDRQLTTTWIVGPGSVSALVETLMKEEK